MAYSWIIPREFARTFFPIARSHLINGRDGALRRPDIAARCPYHVSSARPRSTSLRASLVAPYQNVAIATYETASSKVGVLAVVRSCPLHSEESGLILGREER